jgi:hypothetical protein
MTIRFDVADRRNPERRHYVAAPPSTGARARLPGVTGPTSALTAECQLPITPTVFPAWRRRRRFRPADVSNRVPTTEPRRHNRRSSARG